MIFNRFGDEIEETAGGGGVSSQRLADELNRLESRLRGTGVTDQRLTDELNRLEAKITGGVSGQQLADELHKLETRLGGGQRLTDELNRLETRLRSTGNQQLTDELNRLETRLRSTGSQQLTDELNRFETRIKSTFPDHAKLDEKLNSLQTEFTTDARSMFTKVEDNLKKHVKGADALVQAITLQPKHIGVKGRRIVNVGKSSGGNDAVTRQELDATNKRTKNLEESSKLTENELTALRTWKQNCAKTVSELYEKVFAVAPDATS